MGLSQLFTSFFSYFRDKTWFLMRRGDDQRYRVGAPGDLGEEALQEALLALVAANNLSEAETAIKETYGCCFTNMMDLILYLQSSRTEQLTSKDGLAGALHNVPKTGITGICVEQKHGDILHILAEDDPICGLLQGTTLPLSQNKRVVCSTVTEEEGNAVVCLAVVSPLHMLLVHFLVLLLPP
ncbi:uncharacterized protein LOC121416164 isoform X1 [Lytechinus variegatus]|uniref:uncharacterized protein LOC121416164 isoform X1 n=2 Tax=Lytechinus variegatus TaxID=7654 RepID=UPI001BB19711|nr:uncharacterized protein LOC121416164 isoform X1 [Lytechinus variegatus]